MLLIQEAIEFLISRLDEYLGYHLGVDPKLVEKTLVEKLQLVGVPLPQRLPAEILHFKENDDKEGRALAPPEEKKEDVNNSGALQDNAHDWLTLPKTENFKQKNFVLFKLTQKSSSTGIDQTPLKFFSMTWGTLMLATVEDFTVVLNNGLNEQHLNINKMLILYRFKKYLILLSEIARKSLQEREKKYSENNQIQFDDSVDEWLVAQVNACIQESNELLTVALKNATTSINIGAKLTFEHGAGQTEIMLNTCRIVLEECLKFCKEVNNKCSRTVLHPLSMVDVFPKRIDEHHPLMIINRRAANYFVENLYDKATYQSYKDFNLSIPMSFFLYNPTVADEKREQLLNTLCDFEEKTQKYEQDPEKLWNNIYGCIHNAQNIFKLYTPWFSYNTQKSTRLWGDLHNTLEVLIPTTASSVQKDHQNCKL